MTRNLYMFSTDATFVGLTVSYTLKTTYFPDYFWSRGWLNLQMWNLGIQRAECIVQWVLTTVYTHVTTIQKKIQTISITCGVPLVPFSSQLSSPTICDNHSLTSITIDYFCRFFMQMKSYILSLHLTFFANMFCISNVYFFKLLSNIPVYDYIAVCLSIILWVNIWVVFSFGILWIRLLTRILYRCSHRHIKLSNFFIYCKDSETVTNTFLFFWVLRFFLQSSILSFPSLTRGIFTS